MHTKVHPFTPIKNTRDLRVKGKQISTKAAQTKAPVTRSSEYYVSWSDLYVVFLNFTFQHKGKPVIETTAQKKNCEMWNIVYILNKNNLHRIVPTEILCAENNVQTHN